MPSRAIRWISWIALRSKSADSRNPGRQRPPSPGLKPSRLLSASNSVIARDL